MKKVFPATQIYFMDSVFVLNYILIQFCTQFIQIKILNLVKKISSVPKQALLNFYKTRLTCKKGKIINK